MLSDSLETDNCKWQSLAITSTEETFLQDFLENLEEMFPLCYEYNTYNMHNII